MVHDGCVGGAAAWNACFWWALCGCSSVVEHLLAKERVESSNLFIRLIHRPAYSAVSPWSWLRRYLPLAFKTVLTVFIRISRSRAVPQCRR